MTRDTKNGPHDGGEPPCSASSRIRDAPLHDYASGNRRTRVQTATMADVAKRGGVSTRQLR